MWFRLAKIMMKESMAAVPVVAPAMVGGMFGPMYHGTDDISRAKIEDEGFKVFNGESRQGEIRNGYLPMPSRTTGIVYPVHHLGFGVYFTMSKSIAKDFNLGTTRGLRGYYLNSSNIETINFGSDNTMHRWYISNGYDVDLARVDRVEATRRMTEVLKSKHDAVYFRGKGLRRLLDGDQVCVYRPDLLVCVDPKLAGPMEVGCDVVRVLDGVKGKVKNVRITDREKTTGLLLIPLAEALKEPERYNIWLEVEWRFREGGKVRRKLEMNVSPGDVEFNG